jgi:hypothetical protein
VPTIYKYRTGDSEKTSTGEDLEAMKQYKTPGMGKFTITGMSKSMTTKLEPSQIQSLQIHNSGSGSNRAI